MEKEKKIKIFLGTAYLLIISTFLWVFFDNFSLNEITSYDFIKNNRNLIIEFKNNNFIFITLLFFISIILWVCLLGFASPVCLLAGFIFGKWFGTFIVALGLAIGSTILYIFALYFLKDFIEKRFLPRFQFLKTKFANNEFIFFLIYRFIGGIPFFIANILPTLFNVKIKNFFFGSLLGLTPQIFVWVSLGNGLEKIIENNLEAPTMLDLLFNSEIYLPIIGFIILLIFGIILKKFIYKN